MAADKWTPVKIDETNLIEYMKSTQSTIRFRLAGATYGDRQTVYRTLSPQSRDEIEFVREPENEFDPQAIRVQTKDGRDLGYIPKSAHVYVLVTGRTNPYGKYYPYGIRGLNRILYPENIFGRIVGVFDEGGKLFVAIGVVLDI